MLPFVLGLLILVSGSADTQHSIRQVDFKNFTFPLSGPVLGHHRLEWLDPSKPGHLKLVRGNGASGLRGFTLDSVRYEDVTGDGQEEAIVVIHFKTAGTQQTDYVYIYSFAAGKPKLLAYFHSGDRGSSGLYKVYGEGGKLVVELLDPEKRSGDCCSSGFVRTRYLWRDGQFTVAGSREFGALELSPHPDN